MNDFTEIKESLVSYVEQLDEEKSLELAREALNAGIDPLSLIDVMNEGMKRVGILYDSKDYFIADLIMAGMIFRQVLGLKEITDYFHRTNHKKLGK